MENKKIVDHTEDIVIPIISASEITLESNEPIAKSVFGKIYKGKCRGMDVAIKILHSIEWDPIAVDEFKDEINIMAKLRNPNILLCMGACTDSNFGYAIVMEYMTRGDLHRVLHDPNINLTFFLKLKFAVDIAKGMAWLAALNILHRDLKPANILLDQNWTCKICDFGLSEITKSKAKFRDENEAPGSVLWMAPEVLLGENIDSKLDVYSYSLVLWEIITQNHLFTEYTDKIFFTQDIAIKGKRPLLDNIHPVLQEIIVKSWDRNPDKRPSFEQLLPKLERAHIPIYLPKTLCPKAGKFWEKYFPALTCVPINSFTTKICKELNRKSQNHINCLEALLMEVDSAKEKVVNIGRFCALLKWFGKLNIDQFTIVDRMIDVMRQKWFFGTITADKAQDLLTLQKPGTFLVRLNMGGSNPIEKTPFTISRVAEDGRVVNTRVYPRKNNGFMIQCDGIRFKNRSNNLTDFINTVFHLQGESMLLIEPCSGWPYESLFTSTPREIVYEELDDLKIKIVK